MDPSPNYAVPDVDALGPVPTSAGEIAAYRGRLERVGRAIDIAQDAYAAALHERDDLLAATGRPGDVATRLAPLKSETGALGRRVRLALGEALLALGKLREAREVLLEIIEDYNNDKIAPTYADALAEP